MAEQYIRAEISGTVGQTGQANNGPYTVILVKKPKSEYPDRVTVWGLGAATTGDPITVTGELSWRKSEKDGKTYINVSLNNHEVVRSGSVDVPLSVERADTWNVPTNYDDEIPF